MQMTKSATQMRERRVVTYITYICDERNEWSNSLLNKQLIIAVMAIFYTEFITTAIVRERKNIAQ